MRVVGTLCPCGRVTQKGLEIIIHPYVRRLNESALDCG